MRIVLITIVVVIISAIGCVMLFGALGIAFISELNKFDPKSSYSAIFADPPVDKVTNLTGQGGGFEDYECTLTFHSDVPVVLRNSSKFKYKDSPSSEEWSLDEGESGEDSHTKFIHDKLSNSYTYHYVSF